MMSGELHQMGVVALAKALAERKVSAVETAQLSAA
jgi:aspartyl-tRNA(Asn)/glutamyl-tRNA(Gln) amidotransferase subunit A